MLNQQIRLLRQARKMSQGELAKELNVTKQSVSNWENDMGEPPYETLKKICKYFEVSADFLLGLED